MTDFEKDVLNTLAELVEEATTTEEEDDSVDDAIVCDVVLCDIVMGCLCHKIVDAIMETGTCTGMEIAGADAGNRVDLEDKICYGPENLTCIHMDIDMAKDNKYEGELLIVVRYNADETCEDLIRYKFVPDGENADDIEWSIYHG